jgi:Ca-activated chloride channel family protein
VTESDAVARIELGVGQRMDRDFVLRWHPQAVGAAVTPVLTAAPDDAPGEGTFQLTLFPPHLPEAGRPRDVALVLDRSGSMSGWKMVAARRAVARIVDSLGSGDRFAVLGFDTVVERPATLGEGLVDASDRHRFRAVEFLARLEARGGTELLHPLRDALGLLRAAPGRDRVLVLVTDGQVGNEDQILRDLSTELASVRVHTVGIDQAVNAGFLGRLAVVGGGRCELVESEDRLDEAMDLIHRRIGAPVVTGLRLEAQGFDIDQVSPSRLSDLHPGTSLRICGRYRGTPDKISVTGQRPDGELWRVSVPATTVDNPALATVWARGRLRDLEDRYAAAADPRQREFLEREIVATSLRFRVLCRFTAFVAIDSRAGEPAGEPHRVVQPVEMPAGWQMLAAVSPQPVPASPAMLRTAGAPQIAPAAFMPSRPGPVRGIAADADETGDVAIDTSTVLATELRRLEGLAKVTPALRWTALADLASRLRVLARQTPESERQTLLRMAESLSVCDGPLPQDPEVLERLWRQTLTELDRYVGAKAKSRPGIRRGSFWKR